MYWAGVFGFPEVFTDMDQAKLTEMILGIAGGIIVALVASMGVSQSIRELRRTADDWY